MASALQRFILWDYPRGSWQYDVVVVVIVAFIFLTPREFFRDQPRASSIVMLPAEGADAVFFLEAALLAHLDEQSRFAKAAGLLNNRGGKRHELHNLTPIHGAENELIGFMAYTHVRK